MARENELETQAVIESLTDLAVSQPWPKSNGDRNFRILATLLRWVGLSGNRSLTIHSDLPKLAEQAGLSYGPSIHNALDDLAADGWIKWTVGHGSEHTELRKPSEIKLLPTDHEGHTPVGSLGDPRLSLYERSNGGSAAYLIITRVLHDDAESYSMRGIERLTGISHG